MKVLKTYAEFISEATNILQIERGQVRISSFNLSVRNEDTERFLDLTLAAPSSIMIGTSYSSCTVGCKACDVNNQKRSNNLLGLSKNYNIHVAKNLHLKYISRGNKAIIGGINLTGSSYDDMALVVTDPLAIQSMNEYFDSVFNKIKVHPMHFYTYSEPTFTMGRYKGRTVKEVQHVDPVYITWAKQNLSKTLLKNLGL